MQHLNEQKVITLAEAAVLADEFVLTHRKVFSQEVPIVNASIESLWGRSLLLKMFLVHGKAALVLK